MGELERLCRSFTDLSEADICQLKAVEENLPLMADLADADVFLDCIIDDATALVVSHASPGRGISLYEKRVVGEYAKKSKEPAVFRAFAMGAPVCDLKAITQEERAVRQNAAPIRNKENRIIAVLIQEKDISADLQQQRKYEELAKNHQESNPLTRTPDMAQREHLLTLREMHHRVKNSLQLVASILNLQGRKTADATVRCTLQESVARVLSIAAVHDVLLRDADNMKTVDSDVLLEHLCGHLQALILPEQAVTLRWGGDQLQLSSDTATSVAMVVTELVTNAIRHGFPGQRSGEIEVSVCRGELTHTIAVRDNGVGFAPSSTGTHLGMSIVEATVRDKLKGTLHVQTDALGTQVSFGFKNG